MFCKNCGKEINNGAEVCLGCGVLVGMGDKFCSHCGFEPDPLAVVCIKCGHSIRTVRSMSNSKNAAVSTFGGAIKSCFRKYSTFKGRATRSEYWYFVLFCNLLALIPGSLVLWNMIDYLTSDAYELCERMLDYYGYCQIDPVTVYLCSGGSFTMLYAGMILAGILSLIFLLPSLSVLVRRLHDTGRSGWAYFISLVPFVGGLILLVWLCQDSNPGENEYGENPKGL